MNNKSVTIYPEKIWGHVDCTVMGIHMVLDVDVKPKRLRVTFYEPIEKTEERVLVEYAPIIYTEDPCDDSVPSYVGIESVKRITQDAAEKLLTSEKIQ